MHFALTFLINAHRIQVKSDQSTLMKCSIFSSIYNSQLCLQSRDCKPSVYQNTTIAFILNTCPLSASMTPRFLFKYVSWAWSKHYNSRYLSRKHQGTLTCRLVRFFPGIERWRDRPTAGCLQAGQSKLGRKTLCIQWWRSRKQLTTSSTTFHSQGYSSASLRRVTHHIFQRK